MHHCHVASEIALNKYMQLRLANALGPSCGLGGIALATGQLGRVLWAFH